MSKPTFTPRDLVNTLRYGRHKPAKGILHDRNTGGFCCIGVAAKKAGWTAYKTSTDSEMSTTELPDVARDAWPWLDWGLCNALGIINDSDQGDKFADVIAYLEGYEAYNEESTP